MIRNVATHTTDAVTATLKRNGRTHRAPPLRWICILQQGIGDYEHGKTGVPRNVKPGRALQSGTEQAGGHKQARKGQRPRDDDERSEDISARDREEGTRTQDGELGKQQDSGDRIVHETRRGISRDDGVDPCQLDVRDRPDRQGDQQGQHDGKGKPFLPPAGRQACEDEILFLRDNGGRVHHRSNSSQRLERAARSLYRFDTLIPGCLSSPPFWPLGRLTTSEQASPPVKRLDWQGFLRRM
jgi:hypothetical protein